jgi:ribonuclease D
MTPYDLRAVARGDLPAEFADAYRSSALVAWDIETSGLEWRNAQIGTCQLFAEGVGAVIIGIGPVARPPQLVALLEDPRITKVFHHAPFDLRFMMHEWGVAPASIRCTKVASKLLEPSAPNDVHSLQSLLSRYLGVQVSKGPVRTSDWTAETLSADQIAYATTDVVHLPALLRALEQKLAGLRRDWLYNRCCDFLPARVTLEIGGYPDVFAY